jgi:hypothetical protein
MEDNIDKLEQQVLQMLLEGDDPALAILRIQFGLAKRKPREMSGVGFFTYLDVPEDAPRLTNNASLRFGDVSAEIDGLEHGAGFVLFVDDGVLTTLEAYTYDEPWPPLVTGYELSYMNKPYRDWQSLRATPGWPSERSANA